MQSWLTKLSDVWSGPQESLGAVEFFVLLALSAAAALAVAALYSRVYGARATGSDLHRAFPLLGISITAIFVCIQFSLPLSLGLLGALSIVRFRTPIKEPEEVGFLMVVIATSLACATGKLVFVGVVLVASVVALVVQLGLAPLLRQRADSGIVVASFDESVYAEHREELMRILTGATRAGALESLSAHDGRVSLTWRFRGLAQARAAELERTLHERTTPESVAIVFHVDQPLP
jgi:Domain of unknown function (DUF4956)